MWIGFVLAHDFPRLYSFAVNHHISVKDTMEMMHLDDLFTLPLSAEAFDEYEMLQQRLENLQYDDSSRDQWTFIWGSTTFTSKKFYDLAFNHMNVHPIFKWLWKSKCIPRLKFFAWLILVDRLNTKATLSRRNFAVQPDTYCVMCNDQVEEDIRHLFFDCSFATNCWHKIGIQWQPTDSMFAMIDERRIFLQNPYFMEVFVIAAWEIWNLRNGIIFEGKNASINLWTVKFKDQIIQHLYRVRDDLKQIVLQWLDTIM
jgi:hypothetical protein